MSLIFPRLANNFAKNGYYPTDSETMRRICAMLGTTAQQRLWLLDPCCGEGLALAAIQEHLRLQGVSRDLPAAAIQSYGIEYDKERAWAAKQDLNIVAHSDIFNMTLRQRSMSLLFLNPPYGGMISDTAGLSSQEQSKRFEHAFFAQSHPWLAIDGVLVLVVPYSVFTKEFAHAIARSYRDVKVYMAPVQTYKQCVIFGIKRRSDVPDTKIETLLTDFTSKSWLAPELPQPEDATECYMLPCGHENPVFVANVIDPQEFVHEMQKLHANSLWEQFDQVFTTTREPNRRPLRRLTPWHLALALAAGQICGLVKSSNGRLLLVRGDTHKDKAIKVSYEETGSDGEMREVRVCTDRFVPTIKAFDFTPDSPMFGHLVTIQ